MKKSLISESGDEIDVRNEHKIDSDETIKLQEMLDDPSLFLSSSEIQEDPEINKHLDGEELKYVERILKFNEYNWKQERIIMITPTLIKNVKQKTIIRREIKIKNLTGITINL